MTFQNLVITQTCQGLFFRGLHSNVDKIRYLSFKLDKRVSFKLTDSILKEAKRTKIHIDSSRQMRSMQMGEQ